jgi:hypothetical protein
MNTLGVKKWLLKPGEHTREQKDYFQSGSNATVFKES